MLLTDRIGQFYIELLTPDVTPSHSVYLDSDMSIDTRIGGGGLGSIVHVVGERNAIQIGSSVRAHPVYELICNFDPYTTATKPQVSFKNCRQYWVPSTEYWFVRAVFLLEGTNLLISGPNCNIFVRSPLFEDSLTQEMCAKMMETHSAISSQCVRFRL